MSKQIFNSVGSNYTYGFAFRMLFAFSDKQDQLISYLNNRYKGETKLFYKGREAITYALKTCGFPKGKKVVICGYTCAVVPTAVKNAGLTPIYVDISGESLDFSFETFKNIVDDNQDICAVIIQNTLGFTHDITLFEKYCKEKGIILIEDLAHSVGAKYPDGRETGTVGDFTVLSFSQDKVLDAVSGGALVTRTEKIVDVKVQYENVSVRMQIRDRLYPLRTCKIRSTYGFGIGKFLHFILKKMNALSLPVYSLDNKIQKLPKWYASLILHRFGTLDRDIARRREIALMYLNSLEGYIHKGVTKDDIYRSTSVRVPILVDNQYELIKAFEKEGIHLSDIWYDVPVSPKRYWNLFSNENTCVVSKNISQRMFNLPTHMTLSNRDVERIINTLKKCLK